MNKLKFAIIGCGYIANRHAEHITNLAELKSVCDIKPDRAEALGKKYNCNYYLSAEELLSKENEVDIVSICTPNGLHAEHSILALKSGKHVLCEKPMAIKSRDCEKMIYEAERNNKRLFVVKQNRFNPPIKIIKKALDENRLGKILSVQMSCFWNRNNEYYHKSDWKGKKDLDGGTLFTQFSHFIDLLYWLIGDIKKVKVFAKNLNHQDIIEFEDTGVIAVEFDEGILGTINYTVNSFKKNYEGSLTIFGEKGTVKIGGQYLNTLEYQMIDGYELEKVENGKPANDYGFYQGSMSNHDKVYENVIDVLTNGAMIMTNSLEGLKTVQIIEKIYKAAKK